MAIPDYQSVMRPLLEEISDGAEYPLSGVRISLEQRFELTEEEKKELIPSGKSTTIKSRVGWARTYLHKAGLLTLPMKGKVKITERGLEALKEGPDKITAKWLKQYPEFVTFITPKSKSENSESVDDESNSSESAATPDELMANAHASMVDTLVDDLLAQIKESSPQFFEQLVVDLMLAMGYGGSRTDAGKATQSTSDDGIDGIIKEDRLGLDVIYLQAKRWSNTVHRPEIDKFIGALTRKQASKGVFITTSDFSSGAVEAANSLSMRVILIDGRELARLMVEYDLGVSTKQVFEVKQIDSDYFSEE